LREQWRQAEEWVPVLDAELREQEHGQWKKAVARTFDWVD
jgi:glycerol kinase